MKKFLLPLLIWMVTAAHAVDTLEVYVLRVQFKKEAPDNSLTTGNGLFDSDTAKFSLDSSGRRGTVYYWKKHLDFANSYFKAVSGGKLVIKSRIFPEDGRKAYNLGKQIIDYNRTERMKGEKTAEFDEARSRDYLQFVYDAVLEAHESDDSPFKQPLSKNSNTKRVFMIAHAGANGLLDGGGMGTKGADTPGDFMDAYISKDDWVYLDTALKYTVVDRDSVRGLALKGSAIDTLKSMMVVSETASQDGLNWGINGFIVTQIGRELGLPMTYDVVKGISRLGAFDLMDFAGGYAAGNGFLPSLPAAWERVYMGWSDVKEVRPTAGKSITVDIAAAGSGLGTEVVKVPLNGSEYLLIENRQRSWNKDGVVKFYTGDASESDDVDSIEVSVAGIDSVFLDCICDKGKCKRNPRKAHGLILGASSFDAGIPASGIVVWKVNEWYLRESLQYGYANAWGGNDFRDHQFGISLVEADDILTVGKTFKNALGEDTYDFGSGADLLPHLRFSDKKKGKDTVKTISATGYANTATTNGGYTGLKISVDVPKNARVEKTANAFGQDSVINFASMKISVTISIDDGSVEGGKLPKNVGLASANRGAVFVDYALEKSDEKAIVFAAEDGTLQVMNALGDTLFASDTSVAKQSVSVKDVEEKVPLYRVGPSYGPLVGIAGDGRNVLSLHEKYLVHTKFASGIVPVQDAMELKMKHVAAGPMLVDGRAWFAAENSVYGAAFSEDGLNKKLSTLELEKGFSVQDMAYCKDGKNAKFAIVGKGGKLYLANSSKGSLSKGDEIDLKMNDPYFRVSCLDLDRDDVNEAIVLGSRGSIAAVKMSGDVAWKYSYTRGASGNSGVMDEISGMALGDVNNDGYPEIVFLGDNLVYALDRFGVPLQGFPVKINRGAPVVGFGDPLLVDVSGDEAPEILVPSSDGLVYAYTGKGKLVTDGFPMAAGTYEYWESAKSIRPNSVYVVNSTKEADSVKVDTLAVQPMSIYVIDGVKNDKNKGPELYAFHRDYASAFRLQNASKNAEKSPRAWTLPAGGNERTGYYDVKLLGDANAAKAKDEISEFFIYPNPVREGNAKMRFEIGAPADNVKLEIFDITGLCVFKTSVPDAVAGRNQVDHLDLSTLGSDVYTARLKVKFVDGKTKQKVYRIGVVR